MTDRKIEIAEALHPDFEAKSQQTLDQIKEAYLQDKVSITASFQSAVDAGLKKITALQKGKIKYICVSYLFSSLSSGKCEYRIDFYDSNFYLDQVETACYWEAKFATSLIQEEYAIFKNLMHKKLIRVMDYEVRNLVIDFGAFYFSTLAFYFRELIDSVDWKKYNVLLESEVTVIYGGFQDKGIPITVLQNQTEG